MLIAIVGAGIAGLSCADALTNMGHDVILLDKGRGPGGRMSTRRMDTPLGQVAFDHGAQYFTARDPGFCAQVDVWAERGIVARWPQAAVDAWVGVPGMNAVIKAMAAWHDVRWNVHVDRIERGPSRTWSLRAGAECFDGFDAVLLAIPAEQAVPVLSLHDFHLARAAMPAQSQPCWTGMYAFAAPLPTAQDIIRDAGAIGWAARNSAKPGRQGPEGWVVQAHPEWSIRHLEQPGEVVSAMLLEELSRVLGQDLPEPAVSSAHRWRYARNPGLKVGALWNGQIGLGACGDWLLGPRIECAWLSGQALAHRLAETLAAGNALEPNLMAIPGK